MALDASSFKVLLEGLPNGSEALAYHVGAVEAEKQRGIEESRKANAEAQALRKFKIAIEKLGFNKDGDLDEFMTNLKLATEKASQTDAAKMTVEQITAELTKLKTDFSKTQTELAAERQRAEEIKRDATRKTLKAKLVSVLSDKVYGHDFVADGLINSGAVVLGDNDTVEFVDGDKRVDLDTGLRRLTEQRPDIVKNTQRPGAGSAAPATSGQKKYTIEQLQTLSKDDIRANLKDVKASLGITT